MAAQAAATVVALALAVGGAGAGAERCWSVATEATETNKSNRHGSLAIRSHASYSGHSERRADHPTYNLDQYIRVSARNDSCINATQVYDRQHKAEGQQRQEMVQSAVWRQRWL